MNRGLSIQSVSLAVVMCMSGTAVFGGQTSLSANPTIQTLADQVQSDEQIKYRVEERLRTDGRIDWEALAVEVEKGQVTLYGEVETQDQKGLASLIASTVPRVVGLTNSIIVDAAHSTDYRLQKAVWSTLRGVDALRQQTNTLSVRVDHAVALLSGLVDQPMQKEAAEKAAESVQGVQRVVNAIKVQQKSLLTEQEKLRQEGVQKLP